MHAFPRVCGILIFPAALLSKSMLFDFRVKGGCENNGSRADCLGQFGASLLVYIQEQIDPPTSFSRCVSPTLRNSTTILVGLTW